MIALLLADVVSLVVVGSNVVGPGDHVTIEAHLEREPDAVPFFAYIAQVLPDSGFSVVGADACEPTWNYLAANPDGVCAGCTGFSSAPIPTSKPPWEFFYQPTVGGGWNGNACVPEWDGSRDSCVGQDDSGGPVFVLTVEAPQAPGNYTIDLMPGAPLVAELLECCGGPGPPCDGCTAMCHRRLYSVQGASVMVQESTAIDDSQDDPFVSWGRVKARWR